MPYNCKIHKYIVGNEMAITRLNKHNNCEVEAHKGPFGHHYGKLVCKQHNVIVQWLSQADYNTITGLKNDPSVSKANNAKQRLPVFG